MGCDNSKRDIVEEDEEHCYADEFSEHQIDSIKSTWPILSRDRQKTGVDFFRNIFNAEPVVKAMFKKDRTISDEELLSSPEFLKHVDNFMSALDNVIEKLESDTTETQHYLIVLGAKHATFQGFNEEFFTLYSKCMIDTWESVIGEEFIQEVKEGWEMFLMFITRYMRQGFVMYFQDPKTEDETIV
ncbi:neuroglobin-like isoform X3 [Dreissena polymorpha]|uniref:neuroglobin-like isoform X3 n=1 Tax=Dreissena polymorpha TaxID=45954 RepID=UPI002264A84B|nr:neuroglobin-like isoform X3 [Dreissena polymorpha]